MAPNLKLIVFILLPRTATAFSISPPTSHRHATTARSEAITALDAAPDWAVYSLGHIAGGASGAPIVAKAQKWYRRIPLPSWTPPNFIFSPVWTLLYGLMGVSVSRVAKSDNPLTNLAMKLWACHYALNVSWAAIFFGFQKLRWGLITNYLLILSLGYTLRIFWQIDPLSAYLQLPYLTWVLFATGLNQAVSREVHISYIHILYLTYCPIDVR